LALELGGQSLSLGEWADAALRLLRSCLHGLTLSPDDHELVRARGLPHLTILRKRRIDSLLYLSCRIDTPAQQAYDRVWRAQRELLLAVVGELERRGVPTVIFKGAQFLERWYGGHSLGFLADVDLLVPRDAIGIAKQVLYQMDLRQAAIQPDTLDVVDLDVNVIAATEIDHYELAPFRRLQPIDLPGELLPFVREWQRHPLWLKNERPVLLQKVDVHHRVSEDVQSEALFARAVPSAFGVGLTLTPADQLWITLSRYYNEVVTFGKRYLRDFAYVLPMLAAPDVVDWEIVLAANREYQLRPTLYYYLAFLQRLGAPVPDRVLEALLPNPGVERDWGWQLAGLFSTIDPFPLGLP
jgi:hypothetical protein